MTTEQEQIAELTAKVQQQAETINYLTKKLFGTKSEPVDPNQQTDQVPSTKKRQKNSKQP
ncbi:MAG: hypothetical protein LKG79_03740 [Furfurilactobacillus sp.]|jgi:hypothetical protein|uniref:Transposase n=1 Tax=Furfurilactobacillus milii TaxID=2888272 RepID=A0ABT6DBI0_9LACO|nr:MULTISPECIES: hypothetical protein [Furfurilactobacillus]QLE67220.1 transposase [Furfurilactobacillus rossiae]MCF6161085.1 hypothetical protein [Furfurilactobacillus milii]MCF6163425.1 hypothetical protein [Furfurilactobacillus milii]MCF6418773.1 hypothetical protein [Furfurilactobacillus milii]MCH4011415.1 hypothetical protein [Furfurilactobacillus sp.]